MGQMGRHVGPSPGLGGGGILAQRQLGFALEEVQDRRPGRRMLAQFLSGGKAKEDGLELIVLINRTANDRIFRDIR